MLLFVRINASGFAVAAEHVNDLMGNHVLDGLTGGLEVLTGIEVIRMLRKVLTDDSSHSQTDVGVNVDLADSAAGGLTELLFRNADSTGHVSAVLVDLGNEFLRHGRRTVEHDREAGQLLGALFEHVEPELGLGAGLELVGAVTGTDGDGQESQPVRVAKSTTSSGWVYMALSASTETSSSTPARVPSSASTTTPWS